MEDTELDSSELGTREYWEKAYKTEISNFDDHGDSGDVWFGEDSAHRVIDWICKCGVARDTPTVDLGLYTVPKLSVSSVP